MSSKRADGAGAWRPGAWILFLLGVLLARPVLGQLTGSLGGTFTDGGTLQLSFACSGAPTCSGTYHANLRNPGCSNTHSFGNEFVLSAPGLTQPGPIQGTITLKGFDFFDLRNADGTCSINPVGVQDFTRAITGTWTGTSGNFIMAWFESQGQTNEQLHGALALGTALTAAVRGTIHGTSSNSPDTSDITFSCSGEPTCTGTYRAVDNECSPVTLVDAFTATGLDLEVPGPLQGTLLFRNRTYDVTNPTNGQCTIVPGTSGDEIVNYTGTWNGSTGTIAYTIQDDADTLLTFTGTFTAERSAPPPIFPMTVTANIDTVADVGATIQYRPQDVGSTQSVYVFAVAPATVAKGSAETKAAHLRMNARGEAKDDPVPCVLAQLNAAGQLTAVSASSLQAYVTGVLSAQGQSVKILDAVPTPNVAGATFYVGYGPTSTAMMNNGVNRSAVTVPGSVQCKPEAPQTGWWWNPLEDGRGFSVEVRGNNLFFAAFLYDISGRSTWYVSAGPVSLDGSLYNGDLLSAKSGQTLGGAYPGRPALKSEGPITLAFNSASRGTMIWPGGTVPIERFNIIPNGLNLAPAPNQPESGWWWNEAESGRGFFLEWQGGTLDIAGYMYDDAGNPVWYLTVDGMTTPGGITFAQTWWSYGNGQTLTGPWRQNSRLSTNVAPLTITFSGPETAIMTLPNGRTTNLTRHRF